MLSIMDRITLLDIEINTLFKFAYNLFFVHFIAVLFSLKHKIKTKRNKINEQGKADDIQL